MKTINTQPFYALIAPDGAIQLSTIAEDEITCLGFIKLMHKAGISFSWHELKLKGFSIQQIILTITQGDNFKIN